MCPLKSLKPILSFLEALFVNDPDPFNVQCGPSTYMTHESVHVCAYVCVSMLRDLKYIFLH